MPEASEEDLMRRVNVAQAMLDRVIHTTDNLDEKVGRVFTSMSFLTVGATILYTAFVSQKLLVRVGGVSVVSLLFVGFVILVGLATAFMLQAMGPRIRMPGARLERLPVLPGPTGYADKIASMEEREWKGYFATTALKALYEKWYEESMDEVYVLSGKVDRKAREMKRAQLSFLSSILFLIAIIVLAVSSLP